MELHKVAIRIALNNGNDSTGGGALSDAGFVLNATAFGSALLPGRRRFGLAGWGGDLQPDIANGGGGGGEGNDNDKLLIKKISKN